MFRLHYSQVASLLLHAGVIFALIHLSAVEQMPRNRKQPDVRWTTTKLTWHLKEASASGGGGGHRGAPAARGKLPRTASRQFVPPTAKPPETMPTLPVEPAILGPQDPSALRVPVSELGDPNGRIGPPSDGGGGDRGIGNGKGGGVGDHLGPRHDGGTTGAGLAGSFVNPVLVYSTEPDYPEDARKARLQGTVVLLVEINERGLVENIRVRSTPGLGMEGKAIEAVERWRFRPALRNGRPVRAPALVEVHFHLL